jgi:2-polyprenyl-3-methyl-5-hydroxy-6-metoxy-1,4-benzoquinol methylase
MWPDLRQRTSLPELMDDRSLGGAELRQALDQLRIINRLLGAARPTIEGIEHLWRAAGCPATLSILDIGAGSGDLSQSMLYWAARHGVCMRIILVDIHPETCAAAAAHHHNEPRVTVLCSDLLHLALRPADIVTTALFTHHFSPEELPHVYRAMANAARLGVVVNDLHRHWLAWAAIWLATRLCSRNRMIRHDAPLSVRRGFKAADLRQLRATLNAPTLRFMWRPLFRYLVMLPGGAHAG